ncbi:MAG: hypothetical protein KC457_29095, partial [Myxococcales bacterium]|nr:hypothetical protein [Myxococcales bacterium]
MDTSILVGTRKGTFAVTNDGSGWQAKLIGHAGVGVNFVAKDPNTGRLWALLGHGHWGAKLSVSDDDGASWADLPTQISYPEDARYLAPPLPGDEANSAVVLKDATVLKLWVLGFGPDGNVYVGTIPGGLFVSRDGGDSFELDWALWNHHSRGGDLREAGEDATTERMTHWFGTPAAVDSGEFAPGIHSIAVDPRDANRVMVAISTAGVLETRDGGKSWQGRNLGMLNDYLPDPAAEWGHDPHFVTCCPGQPDRLWQQ